MKDKINFRNMNKKKLKGPKNISKTVFGREGVNKFLVCWWEIKI